MDSYDDTIDNDFDRRCKTFLRGEHRCFFGEFCNKFHRYPKEDGVMCRLFKVGKCNRDQEECWFQHSEFQSRPKKKTQDLPFNVQPLGELMKELRQKAELNRPTSSGVLRHNPQNGAARKYQSKVCSQCSRTFANSTTLSQHTRIHLGIKPYRCEICQRKFTQLSHVQQHIRTHTGDKPYKCRHPGCSKAYSQLSNLQSHSKCHQTNKLKKKLVKKIIGKKFNTDRKINTAVEQLWNMEQMEKILKQKTSNNRDMREFVIDKYQIYKETAKITWRIPKPLKIAVVNDLEIDFSTDIEEIEIPKEQVTEVEKDDIYIWRVPEVLKIVEVIEDSSIANELKKIKELQSLKENLVKELNETKVKIQEIDNKIKFKLQNIDLEQL